MSVLKLLKQSEQYVNSLISSDKWGDSYWFSSWDTNYSASMFHFDTSGYYIGFTGASSGSQQQREHNKFCLKTPLNVSNYNAIRFVGSCGTRLQSGAMGDPELFIRLRTSYLNPTASDTNMAIYSSYNGGYYSLTPDSNFDVTLDLAPLESSDLYIYLWTYNISLFQIKEIYLIKNDITSNGGGATHIAKVTGQLKDLSSNLSDILLVSGGGGGGLLVGEDVYVGADAGGISGSGDLSGNQSTGYAFGQGESATNQSGGGSGYYGGKKSNA